MKGHRFKVIKVDEKRGLGNVEIECECGMKIFCVGLVLALRVHAEHVTEMQMDEARKAGAILFAERMVN